MMRYMNKRTNSPRTSTASPCSPRRLLGADEAAILEAIQSGCVTATDIGARLKAGTNCGSCVPEIKALLAQYVVKKIA